MKRKDLDLILTKITETYENFSDILFTVGRPIQVEVFGALNPVRLNPPLASLTPYQTEQVVLALIGPQRSLLRELLKEGSCDLSYQVEGKISCRVNIFSQRRGFSIVMRRLPVKVPTIEELGLPAPIKIMAREINGLVLVTGATGMGKTTTLAALLNAINQTRPVHIVTLEDPIEYIHDSDQATFNQRELGLDFIDYAQGLRAALRQAPKVILVGEIRDRETADIVLTAAETGHLVLSTLHTLDAGHTLNRLIGLFEVDEERQIRMRLADSLRWIVCQRLVPKLDGGFWAIFEILANTLRIKDILLNGEREERTYYQVLSTSKTREMQTFDQDLLSAFEAGKISQETALTFASDRSYIIRGMDRIKAARGEKTSTIEGLILEKEEKGFL